MKLFSYVVEHDDGFAPNPYYGVCTLAHCKWKGKNNVVKLAVVGDWVVGTGGQGKRSAGHGKLIYAMHVDEKLTLRDYYRDPRFQKKKPRDGSYQQRKGDNLSKAKHSTTRSVLISKKYFYFGDKAQQIPRRFRFHSDHPLEKKGPHFRSRFNPKFVKAVTGWLERNFSTGMHGRPCGWAIDKSKTSQLKSCR